MRSIRRNLFKRQKKILLAAFSLIFVATLSYITVINPLFSHAEARYMTATITDDNGTVDFSPGINNAEAKFTFVRTGCCGSDSNTYDAKIILRDLPSGSKQLKVELPAGMSWVDDGGSDNNLISQLDSSKGENGIGKEATSHAAVKNYTFPKAGSRIYYIQDGAIALTVNIKIKADAAVVASRIDNAVRAELILNGSTSETAELDVNVPQAASAGGFFYNNNSTIYVKPGETRQSLEHYYRLVRSAYLAEGYDVGRLIQNVKFYFTLDNPSAKIILYGANADWSIDNSEASSGKYTITWTPSGLANGEFYLPYAIVVPDDAPGNTIYKLTGKAETTFWQLDGSGRTDQFTNEHTVFFHVSPTGSAVTIGYQDLNPTSLNDKDTQYYTSAYVADDVFGTLGVGYMNNKGSADSGPKVFEASFDTDVLGVMGVELTCEPGGTLGTVHIETVSGVSKDVALNKSCNTYGFAGQFTYKDFGIERYDYIKLIRYNFGIFKASTHIHQAPHDVKSFCYMGKLLRDDRGGDTTIKLFDANNLTTPTNSAKITTTRANRGTLDITHMDSRVINAGDTMHFGVGVSNWANTTQYDHTVLTPIIFIRQEIKDASGNFLPISNLKITNGSTRGNVDITSKFSGLSSCVETETACVYKIDGRTAPRGVASMSSMYFLENGTTDWSTLDISWDVETSLTTPDQQYHIKDLVFVQDPDFNGSITTHDYRGDPYSLSGTAGNTIYAATTNYYQIRGWASIGAENAGKHTSSDTWLTWTEGSNPITIGSADGSLADMKATMINNSGVSVPGPTTIYLPIPKKEQNWGSLSYDNKVFEFSTALTGAISNPDNNHFMIAYGKNITPSDDGSDLNGQNAKFTTNTSGWTDSDWKEVNCIKITATNIPANRPGTADSYDFIYKLKVVDAVNASDGAVNTWRPLYFQQLTNSAGDIFAGWYKGSYVSVKLADGKVSGQIFIDANENGKKDSGEQDLKEAGWKIDLYDKTSNRLVRSTTTDANGKYNFIELAMNADGYYITVTNKHPINSTGTTYLIAPKGTTSNTGAYNTDNQAEGSTTSTPAHATAYVGPVSPSHTTGEANYNIGVVVYEATENYAGQVSFNDQNNRYNTRPTTVAITARASDGTTTTINVATNNEGVWSKDLPKYNQRGEKLSYEFSAPDLANYNKSDRRADTYTYNVAYTQKTATLTVNHYKKGTTESLAPTTTTTVYWGQTYTTSQATVESNYEYDSISGAASGPVSGNVTVTYYYKLKTGTITTHYYIKDTTTKIAPDNVQTKNYTETYTTSPLASIPAAYQNYELVSEHPEGYTDTVSKPNTEVIYYYQKKDPNLSSDVSIQAPESVASKTAQIPYEISYSANIKDHIGNITITLVDKLPYPIVVDESELDGGAYDAEAKTITWTVTRNYNSYSDGEEMTIAHNISLVYDGAKASDSLANTIETNIALDGKENAAGDSVITIVKTPAKIIYRFTDQDGNEIQREAEDEGYVGEQSDFEPPEIPGYRLIKDTNINLRFGEEEHTVFYRYEKLPEPVSPTTGDNIVIYFTLLGGLIAASGLIAYRCKYLKR